MYTNSARGGGVGGAGWVFVDGEVVGIKACRDCWGLVGDLGIRGLKGGGLNVKAALIKLFEPMQGGLSLESCILVNWQTLSCLYLPVKNINLGYN